MTINKYVYVEFDGKKLSGDHPQTADCADPLRMADAWLLQRSNARCSLGSHTDDSSPQRSACRFSAGFATAKPGSQRSFWAKAHLDLHRSHHAGGSFGGTSTHLLDPLRHGPLHLVRSQRVDDDGHDLEGNLSQKENPAVVLQYQSITLFYAIHAQPYLRLEVQ